MKKLQDLFWFGIALFCVGLGMTGILGGFFSYLPLTYDKASLLAGAFLGCLWFSLIYDQRRPGRRRIGLAVSVAGILYCICREWETVLESFYGIFGAVLDKVNEVYQMDFILKPIEGLSPGEATPGLLVISAVLAMGLAYVILGEGSPWIAAFFCLLPLVGALMLNTVPSVESCICCILCFLGGSGVSVYTLDGERGLKQRAAVNMLILGGLAALGAFWGMKQTPENFREINQQFRSYINRQIEVGIQGGWSLGGGNTGVQTGDLNREGGFDYTGARMLEVTVERMPEDTLYLRGFVGASYRGDRWETNSRETLLTYAKKQGWENQENLEQKIYNLGYILAEMRREQTGEAPAALSVGRLQGGNTYTYMPYGALLEEPMKIEGDGIVWGEKEKVKTFTAYPPLRDLALGSVGFPFPDAGWAALYQEYSAYVKDAYLSYPEELLLNLTEECRQQPIYSMKAIADHIRERLSGAAYNLKAPSPPRDRDFTEYFLYESREGYCVHFATAATLMFRMYGIPARYAAGYIAPVSAFQKNKEGTYTAYVEDHLSHAWTEIYVPSAGWTPVEMTPGYSGAEEGEGAGTPPVTASPTPEESRKGEPGEITPSKQEKEISQLSKEEETEEGKQDLEGKKEEGNFAGRGILKILKIFPALLMVLLLAVGNRFRLLARRRRYLERTPREAICYLYRLTHRALGRAAPPPDSPAYLQRLEEACPGISGERLRSYMDLLLAALYGNREFTPREMRTAHRMYQQIIAELYRRQSRLGKIRYLFWEGFL